MLSRRNDLLGKSLEGSVPSPFLKMTMVKVVMMVRMMVVRMMVVVVMTVVP